MNAHRESAVRVGQIVSQRANLRVSRDALNGGVDLVAVNLNLTWTPLLGSVSKNIYEVPSRSWR